MKLLIVVISHNRLNYTKRTMQYLFYTLTVDNYIIMADNASTDGTQDYIKELYRSGKINDLLLFNENHYPGKATNEGWATGLDDYDATHLMRLDNDMLLKKGWDKAAESYFKAIPELGQLGIDHEAIEHPRAALRELKINGKTINTWPGCVGGPNIIRRRLWNMGIRYPELKWDDGRRSPIQEDSKFSRLIQDKGYLTGHMTEDLARTFANESNWHEYRNYYKKTLTDRGYDDKLRKAGL